MASWQSHFMIFAIRSRQMLRGNRRQQVWDENTSVADFRELCEQGAQRQKMPDGVEAVPVKIEGLPAGLSAEWLQPTAAARVPEVKDAVIFYTHGGGYISGSCSDHRALVAKFVVGSGIRLLLFEYRLAPEHPYPAAMEDTLTAYRWLLGQVTPSTRIIIAGESAGGGLCLATLLALKDLTSQGEAGLRYPIACISLSPWVDLKITGKQNRVKFSIEPARMELFCSKYYAGDHDPGLPWISPLYGDLRGFPPTLIFVGDQEGLLDNAVRFAEKAKTQGVDLTLRIGEGQLHCYPLLPDFIPESKQGMEEIYAFLRKQLNKAVEPVAEPA